jgi:hypothetical protein
MFLTNDGLETHPALSLEPFDGTTELNDYEVNHLHTFQLFPDCDFFINSRYHGRCGT